MITFDLSCEKCGHKWQQTAKEKDGVVTVVAECPKCKKDSSTSLTINKKK